MLSTQQQKFTTDIANLILYADSIGYSLTFGECWRSRYQQAEYVRKGLSTTMNSKHLKRLAVDFNVFIDGRLTYDKDKIEPLGTYWEELDKHNIWGGRWVSIPDTCHFERNI